MFEQRILGLEASPSRGRPIAAGARERVAKAKRGDPIKPEMTRQTSPRASRSPSPRRRSGKSNGYVFFFALAFFAAFFAGFSFFAFSAFTVTGVLAARRIDRA